VRSSIAGHARHQPANRFAIVIREGKLLEFIEAGLADVVADRDRGPARKHDEAEDAGSEPDQQSEIAQCKGQKLDVPALRQYGIDDPPGQIGEHHIAHRSHCAQNHHGDNFPLVGQREAKHFPPQREIHFAGEDIFFHGRWGAHWIAP
jgi:hypothetical protein